MTAREAFNVLSHALGALLALAVTVALVLPPLQGGHPRKAFILAVFGVTLVLGYAVSTLFHLTHGGTRELFRRLDRSAIYLLIIGGYTPLALLALPRSWGLPLLLLAGAIAAIGVLRELRHPESPHSVRLYLMLGWILLLAFKPLLEALTPAGIAWLVAGGLLYTAGAVTVRFHLIKRSHEVWHVFALAASACHVVVVYFYIR